MTDLGVATAALAGYVAYRIGRRLMEENSGNRPAYQKTRKVHRSPLPEIGVDVSARTADKV
jgi:hypothetical protein